MGNSNPRLRFNGRFRRIRKKGTTGFTTGLTVTVPDRILALVLVAFAAAPITGPWEAPAPTAPDIPVPQEVPAPPQDAH